jgi:PAS domain-containing protein
LEVEDMTVVVAGGEQLWQLTVEHSPVGTTLVAPDGRLLSANQALCDMLGAGPPGRHRGHDRPAG